MAKSPIKVASFSGTTSGTVAVTFAASPNHGSYRSNYWVEITSVGSGSGWSGVEFKWVSPGGNALSIGTIATVTSTTNSGLITFTTALVAATACANPNISHVRLTNQTAGTTTSIAGDIYMISGD